MMKEDELKLMLEMNTLELEREGPRTPKWWR